MAYLLHIATMLLIINQFTEKDRDREQVIIDFSQVKQLLKVTSIACFRTILVLGFEALYHKNKHYQIVGNQVAQNLLLRKHCKVILKEKIYIITNKTNLSRIESAGGPLAQSVVITFSAMYSHLAPFLLYLHSFMQASEI